MAHNKLCVSHNNGKAGDELRAVCGEGFTFQEALVGAHGKTNKITFSIPGEILSAPRIEIYFWGGVVYLF